jgi:hypothetical protein
VSREKGEKQNQRSNIKEQRCGVAGVAGGDGVDAVRTEMIEAAGSQGGQDGAWPFRERGQGKILGGKGLWQEGAGERRRIRAGGEEGKNGVGKLRRGLCWEVGVIMMLGLRAESVCR